MQPIMKLLIGGVVLIVLTMAFGWLLFPMILKMKMQSQVQLKPGKDMRDVWRKLPFAFQFRVYLFNVTNPDEIKEGQKPIVKQVGPYYFDEWQEKVDLVDREEDDSVEFSFKNKWIFKPELSGEGLTGNEELVLPHLFILAMVMTTEKENAKMLPVLYKAVNSIFKNPDNIFMKIRVMDFLFDGLIIDCNVDDFAGSAVCAMLADAEGLVKDGEKRYKFSVFGAKNNTAIKKKMRVIRGSKRLKDVGVVIEYANKPNISTWNDDYCDTFNGTDGTIFHPFLYKSEDVVVFSPDLCRSLSLTYQHKIKVAGVKTNRYSTTLGDPNTIPAQKCYCEAPDKCVKKGVMDLFKCTGAPMIASHPHFYAADEAYLGMVDGLKPVQEKHQFFLDIDPLSGSPIEAKKRLQFNMFIHKIDKIKFMKNFPDALLPLFWIEEGVVLPDDMVKQVKSAHKLILAVSWIKWLLIVAGIAILGVAGYLSFRRYKIQQFMMMMAAQQAAAAAAQAQQPPDDKSSAKEMKPMESVPLPPKVD